MILLPTLNRPALLTQFLKAANETEMSLPGMILVDENDYSINNETYERIESTLPDNWHYRITKAVSMGGKITEVWPEIESHSAVSVINDDHYPVTKGWDRRLYAQLNGKNFVSCSDRWMAPMKAAGLTAFSMPLLKAWGFPMFPPGITHLFIDDIFESIGKATGCWDIDMSVVILHKHVMKRESPMDKTHQKVYYAGWERGPERLAYENFMKNELPGVIQRTQELQKSWELKTQELTRA